MIPILDERTVASVLDEPVAFALARRAFRLIAEGKTGMPPKIYLTLPDGDDFRAMPAFFRSGRVGGCGVKWVSVFPGNPSRGLPTVIGTVLLNSPKTGELLAVVAANTITALRTAASAAVATHYLASKNPRTLAIVGAGLQATYQLRALLSRHRYERVRVWGFGRGEAARFCARHARPGTVFEASPDVRSCVTAADVIVTCTPSRRPLVRRAWVRPGAHINAIGADAHGKEELEPALVRAAKVVVDEWEQAVHSGEINVPVSRGLFTRRHLHADLAEVVSGRKPGRTRADEITIFDSTGLAVLDIVFARHVFEATQRR